MKVDQYILKEIIAQGKFGNVRLTSVENDPKKYATKLYEREKVENNEMKRNLQNEIKILKYLQHPNIIKLYDIKKSKKHFFLIFEYCNGGTLLEALEKYIEKFGKPFSEEIIQYLMLQIINAFKYIHWKRIMHGNIKLENILLNYENEEDSKNINLMKAKIKISHFDKSMYIRENYKEDLYYELENINIKDLISNPSIKNSRYIGYNRNADMWLIGAICYHMLIGLKVFFKEDFEKVLEQIRERKYSLPTNLSYEIISFINGMLLYEPQKRFDIYDSLTNSFLERNVKYYKKIYLEKVADKIESNKNEIKDLNKINIWYIFNEKDAAYLSSVFGREFIDKKEELEILKKKLKDTSDKEQTEDIPNNIKNEEIEEIIEEIPEEDFMK